MSQRTGTQRSWKTSAFHGRGAVLMVERKASRQLEPHPLNSEACQVKKTKKKSKLATPKPYGQIPETYTQNLQMAIHAACPSGPEQFHRGKHELLDTCFAIQIGEPSACMHAVTGPSLIPKS